MCGGVIERGNKGAKVIVCDFACIERVCYTLTHLPESH